MNEFEKMVASFGKNDDFGEKMGTIANILCELWRDSGTDKTIVEWIGPFTESDVFSDALEDPEKDPRASFCAWALLWLTAMFSFGGETKDEEGEGVAKISSKILTTFAVNGKTVLVDVDRFNDIVEGFDKLAAGEGE